jgi:hypothetical protein
MAVAAIVLAARAGRAEGLVGVSWEAPAPCPDEAAVKKAVDQWLSEPMSDADLRTIHVVARVKPHPSGFVLDLSFESKSGSGHETLVAVRCETLADIVSLKIALAVDPEGIVESAEPARESKTPRPIRKKPPTRLEYAVRATAGAGFGPVPGVGPAASLSGSVIWRTARLELGAGYFFPEIARYDSTPEVGATFSLASASLRACAVPRLDAVEIPTCAGVEAGVLRGTGFGIETVETADRPWVAFVLGPAVAVPLSEQLFLWLEGDLVLGVVRPAGYGVRNLGPLYGPEIGAARGWAGLEVRFW